MATTETSTSTFETGRRVPLPHTDPGGRNRRMAYAIFRVTLGLNIFLHGFVRILTGPGTFEANTEKLFTATFLPMVGVHFFLSVLPYIEAVTGALLLVGLFTFWALVAGALLMLVLIFGTGARQDWNTVGTQTLYGLFYYFLIAHNEYNWLSVDCFFRKRP